MVMGKQTWINTVHGGGGGGGGGRAMSRLDTVHGACARLISCSLYHSKTLRKLFKSGVELMFNFNSA